MRGDTSVHRSPETYGPGSSNTTPATIPQPLWPVEIDLVYIDGKIKLSQQGSLLQEIFQRTFENIRCDLVFNHAFPDPVTIPSFVRKCLVAATEALTCPGGNYNVLAARAHQRVLSDVVYEKSMIRLVSTSTITSIMARPLTISAACTHTSVPSGREGALCKYRTNRVSGHPSTRHDN